MSKNTVVLECFADHENAFSEGEERMVNQEDSFDLDKLQKSQKTLGFFNI